MVSFRRASRTGLTRPWIASSTASHRAWPGLRPPKAARAIARGNALRVLGVKTGK